MIMLKNESQSILLNSCSSIVVSAQGLIAKDKTGLEVLNFLSWFSQTSNI